MIKPSERTMSIALQEGTTADHAPGGQSDDRFVIIDCGFCAGTREIEEVRKKSHDKSLFLTSGDYVRCS